jgi:hypothetical protein
MNPETKAKLIQMWAAAQLFLLKSTKVWVAVAAGVVGLTVGAWLF